jgi:hypothetical protein
VVERSGFDWNAYALDAKSIDLIQDLCMQLMQSQEVSADGLGASRILKQCLLSSGGLWIPDAAELLTWLSQCRADLVAGPM